MLRIPVPDIEWLSFAFADNSGVDVINGFPGTYLQTIEPELNSGELQLDLWNCLLRGDWRFCYKNSRFATE